MDGPPATPQWAEVVTAAERPDLWLAAADDDTFRWVWPEYNQHGNNTAYFATLFSDHADVQLLVIDRRSGDVAARGRTIPFPWDGSLADLPPGIDAVGRRGMEAAASQGAAGAPGAEGAAGAGGAGSRAMALAALAAEVLPAYQRMGLSRVVIQSMATVARRRGFDRLAAPVRPSWKDRYPITPIERYAEWRRQDGLPFDPWMRVHARLGASVLRAEPRSMEITRPVAEWEEWTGVQFPEDGDYVFPGGLAPLSVQGGLGRYWEPNVWMLHDVGPALGDPSPPGGAAKTRGSAR
jgi:GNAT superfamily N-acetyltransferase